MSGQPVVLQVVILRDGLLVGTEVFVPGSYGIGSTPQADLQLDDPTISPQQAVLYFQNGKAAIQDMGGGVFVNGIKITACEIRSMDEIQVGPFILKARVVQQKQTAAPPPEVAALLGGQPPAPSGAMPLGASPPQSSWPSMPVPHPPSQISQRAPSLMPTPAPVAPGPQGTVASARRVAQMGHGIQQTRNAPGRAPPPAPAPASASASEPTTDEFGLAGPPQDHKPTQQYDMSKHEMPTLVPGSEQAPAPRASRKGNGALGPAKPTSARAAPKPAPQAAPPAAPQPARPVARAGLRVYYRLHWQGMRHAAMSFAPRGRKKPKPILASTALGPEFPYWGFDVPKGKFPIAEPVGDFFRVFVPEGAKVERRQPTSGGFQVVPPGEMDEEVGRRYLALSSGAQARFTAGGMTLYAWVGPPAEKVRVNPLRGLPWLLIAILFVLSGGAGGFLMLAPAPREEPDFTAKGLDPVAVRLAVAEPEKKKTAREKVKQIKDRASQQNKAEKVEKKPVRKEAPAVVTKTPPAESKALKQLARLSAAGPAMGDMLAAVDKLGNGPGSKNARSNFKLSGLVGKAPIANAGLGTFGLGGGGKGGIGTLGAEILRGRGGGGIGAMGAGSVGRGAVGGMVTHATSRSVGVPQGNIDREAVAKTINAHLQEIRGCYERALLKDPGLAGKVVLEWTISTTGAVSAAKTKSSSLRNASVEGCILSALKTWQFPQPRGGVVIISYPFLFNSVGF